jgi:hypothetical protein
MFVSHCRRCSRMHPVHQPCAPIASLGAWLHSSEEERRLADHAERAAVALYLRARRKW